MQLQGHLKVVLATGDGILGEIAARQRWTTCTIVGFVNIRSVGPVKLNNFNFHGDFRVVPV